MSSSTVSITSETSGGKSVSHSIRAGAETVLERSRDAVQTKDHLPTNSTTKLRKRTAVKKPGVPSPKPLWKTVISVIMKNFAFLVIVLLLAQMIRRPAFNQGSGFDSILFRNPDYERRIAEVEAFFKTTAKMMHRKIDNEISGLKTEFTKRLDDKDADFSSRFTELDGRVKTIEKSLTTDWVSKDEFNKFLEEFKGKKGVNDISELKLDEVRAFAREIVEKEIEKHAADGLGRVDYAVASGGGIVLKHSEPLIRVKRLSRYIAGNVHRDAVKILQSSFGQPGECFPLKGDNGFVEIKLRTAIIPEAITLEHVSKSVAFDRSSAPKNCKVFGWRANKKGAEENKHLLNEFTYNLEISNATFNVVDTNSTALKDCKAFGWRGNGEGAKEKKCLLTEFTYDLEKSNAQTFNVVDKEATAMDTVRLEFESNQGNPSHTCIYRVRVHGHEPNVIA